MQTLETYSPINSASLRGDAKKQFTLGLNESHRVSERRIAGRAAATAASHSALHSRRVLYASRSLSAAELQLSIHSSLRSTRVPDNKRTGGDRRTSSSWRTHPGQYSNATIIARRCGTNEPVCPLARVRVERSSGRKRSTGHRKGEKLRWQSSLPYHAGQTGPGLCVPLYRAMRRPDAIKREIAFP